MAPESRFSHPVPGIALDECCRPLNVPNGDAEITMMFGDATHTPLDGSGDYYGWPAAGVSGPEV